MKYTYGALSPNDPSQVPLKFTSLELANKHAETMNALIDTWEENVKGTWNKEHWKEKPLPWVVQAL